MKAKYTPPLLPFPSTPEFFSAPMVISVAVSNFADIEPTLAVALGILKVLFTIYDSVQYRRKQLGYLLERCKKLLDDLDGPSGRDMPAKVQDNLTSLLR